MDRFLFAHNPLKPAGETGLQGYIVDTVKDIWMQVDIEPSGDHRIKVVKCNLTTFQEDITRSCLRASRWYNSLMIQKGIEAMVYVDVQDPWMNPQPSTVNSQPSTEDEPGPDTEEL